MASAGTKKCVCVGGAALTAAEIRRADSPASWESVSRKGFVFQQPAATEKGCSPADQHSNTHFLYRCQQKTHQRLPSLGQRLLFPYNRGGTMMKMTKTLTLKHQITLWASAFGSVPSLIMTQEQFQTFIM